MPGRPQSEYALRVAREGTPVAAGVITATSGTSTTNVSTSSPFTVRGGSMIRLVSDLACVVNIGAAAATAVTSSNYGLPMASGVPLFILTPESPAACVVAVAAAATVNVNVATMS